MVRTGIGICVALLGIAGCNKTPEDPGLTATAGATATATDGSGDESSEGGEETAGTQGQTSTSGPDMTTEPPASSSGMAETGPVSSGEEGCGDGMVVPGEQCDGADLQGFDCASLGLGGGTLACDPVTCSFDTSMCMSTSSGTSG